MFWLYDLKTGIYVQYDPKVEVYK